jgi:hypothetical protein
MKVVELYGRVRHAVRIEGLSRREAARRFGLDPRTVAKMLVFSVPPRYRRSGPPARPKLDPFVGIIDQILEDDKGRPARVAQLIVIARRFRCDAVLCGRQIFTERFADGALAPSVRRTARLDCIVHHLGLALGGRPAATFARRLMLPVSKDTLLRVVRRRTDLQSNPPRVVGIDDWAWRRNQRYASIVCDLERRRVVRLLPDREPATAQAWFVGHPTIEIIARDRGGGYGEAAAKALPHAVQVADRWHLMENASRAFLDAVRKSMRQIRSAIGATTINPKLLTEELAQRLAEGAVQADLARSYGVSQATISRLAAPSPFGASVAGA